MESSSTSSNGIQVALVNQEAGDWFWLPLVWWKASGKEANLMFVLAEHITVFGCGASTVSGCSPEARSGLSDCGRFESYTASREDHEQAPWTGDSTWWEGICSANYTIYFDIILGVQVLYMRHGKSTPQGPTASACGSKAQVEEAARTDEFSVLSICGEGWWWEGVGGDNENQSIGRRS